MAFDFYEDPSRVTIDERKGEENEPEEDPVLHGKYYNCFFKVGDWASKLSQKLQKNFHEKKIYREKLNAHKVSIWLKKWIQKNKIFFICINTEL